MRGISFISWILSLLFYFITLFYNLSFSIWIPLSLAIVTFIFWAINLQFNRDPGTAFVFACLVNLNWALTLWIYHSVKHYTFVNPERFTQVLSIIFFIGVLFLFTLYIRVTDTFKRSRENQDKTAEQAIKQLKVLWQKLFRRKETEIYFTLGKKVEL